MMQDFPSHALIEGDYDKGMVLIADHATNLLPARYGTLGLPEQAFRRHIAFDIGVEALTRALSARLKVPAVMSRFSRLLIDPNRGEDDPTLIMGVSDGAIIPANHPLDHAEREHRLAVYYRPYHQAVNEVVVKVAAASGSAPLVLSLHSYTPFWKNVARPWHAAVLWDNDPRASQALIASLRAAGDVEIGDNEPYDGALKGDTLYRHCMTKGIAHALLEVRQDLIGDASGISAWTERLAPIFAAMNDDPALHEYRRFASRADTGQGACGNEPSASGNAEFEAAAFRRLARHLRERGDVQNIDLMNLAGFCRNCLSEWYREAALASGSAMTKEQSRRIVYGMAYETWKALHQGDASAEQRAAFEANKPMRTM